MPNKTVVGQYLDKLSPAAELCGAVNTIVNENGVLTGHITDGIGFMQALKDNDIDVIGKKMTIAGAGGAATAIEIQAALDGVKEISIFNIHDKFCASNSRCCCVNGCHKSGILSAISASVNSFFTIKYDLRI